MIIIGILSLSALSIVLWFLAQSIRRRGGTVNKAVGFVVETISFISAIVATVGGIVLLTGA